MSFETVALFPGSSLIKYKALFLRKVSKENFLFSFVFLQFSSFSKFLVPVDPCRFKSLAIFFFCYNNIIAGLTFASEKRLKLFSRIFCYQLFNLCLEFQTMSF